MRLLHVVPTYFPATRYGGPIFAVHGLCRALARRGHDVHVFTTNVDGGGVSDVPLDGPVDLDGVQVHYFASELRRLYVSRSMRRALARDAGAFDLVHLHSVFLWPTWAAARAARNAGVPYIVSPRGMLVPELIERKSSLAKRAWIALIERRNLANAAAIHFTARREWDDAARLGVPLPSPFIVPNGVDLPPPAHEERDERLLLFLGRVNWKKGLDRLVDAMRLVDARLVVAGPDDDGYTATLRARADDRVEFRGPVAGAEKDALLRRAAALVLPSISENFGNVVLEAMASATPVIVTPAVGLADDVRASGAGIVSEPDPPSLAAAIETLLGDPSLRAEMGRRGRALAEERFTWERVAAAMDAAYVRSAAGA